MTVSEFITDISYSLRNDSGEFINDELLTYLNRSYNFLYNILVKQKSEIVQTGSNSFSTIAGTQSYDLTSSGINITDMWVPHRVWVSKYEPMNVCYEEDLYSAINLEEQGSTGSRTRPTDYCLIGNTIWFKQVPNDIYTINLKYFPTFSKLTSTASEMPFLGMFNLALGQAVEMYAKYRNEININLDTQLTQLFNTETLWMLGKRSKKNTRISFDSRLRNR